MGDMAGKMDSTDHLAACQRTPGIGSRFRDSPWEIVARCFQIESALWLPVSEIF